MSKSAYQTYMFASNIEGSGKATSYIRALDLLSQMLMQKPEGFFDCINIWEMSSIDRLEELRLKVLEEQRKGNRSIWNIEGIPRSYLQRGYCSAALKSYQRFLVEHLHEQNLLRSFHQHSGSATDLASRLNQNVTIPAFLQNDYENMVGTDVTRSVTVRSNQNVFRKMILEIYEGSCCITGLDIPAVNRASHIVPWAEDKDNRMNPSNGLCLSATYDAAFDRNLISFDEDYRLILSRDIRDHFASKSVSEYFLKKEGQKIKMPKMYEPNISFLEQHRNKGRF
ncbi:HNH endonuclease [Endozoicomonas gorgoniicola]|uniref:HNH endonuclease n=1 Tax=Endozoicomonas gorgoniicola TaxID=1234144 RepID=A0ABT3N011_9GAMM|nr:HNH endonuclease [Endozoicomonas gorgoniicola]MCW7554958.1 HNH endonuclease [Endozoicomonas gorgoniicola]